jgi:hypothetical protein
MPDSLKSIVRFRNDEAERYPRSLSPMGYSHYAAVPFESLSR